MSRAGRSGWVRFARPLTELTLSTLPENVRVPTYRRAGLRRGVVHISAGSFHRAHQAAYFDELACQGHGDGWALTGVGMRSREMAEVLRAQDGLYTLIERGETDSARVIGAIARYLYAPEEGDAVLAALAHPDTRLVTLTITADGYGVDARTGAYREGATSAVALVAAALDRRMRAGLAPFTVLSCDNMPDNGVMARNAVVGHAELRDPRLAAWIRERVAFPSCMVDRITPATTVEDRLMVQRVFGVRDRWPVMTEAFSQWVIEDQFCNGRPPLERVGVEFVGDVRPYALMKTRMLNATHSALGYLGTLAGLESTADAMADPVLSEYTRTLMQHEIAPLLPRGAMDPDAYGETLRTRFANRAVADPLARLCRNGSTKVPAHLLSSIRDARSLGRPHELLTLSVAAWLVHLRGDDVDDPAGARLHALAVAGGEDPRPVLSEASVFGALGRDPDFIEAIERDLRALSRYGAEATMAERLDPAAPIAA